jgi:hypothetical protein
MAMVWQGARRVARGTAWAFALARDQSARFCSDFENSSDFQDGKKRLTSVDEN